MTPDSTLFTTRNCVNQTLVPMFKQRLHLNVGTNVRHIVYHRLKQSAPRVCPQILSETLAGIRSCGTHETRSRIDGSTSVEDKGPDGSYSSTDHAQLRNVQIGFLYGRHSHAAGTINTRFTCFSNNRNIDWKICAKKNISTDTETLNPYCQPTASSRHR
jgi:hypothetical protein